MAHKLDGFVKQINLLGKQIMINVMGYGEELVLWYHQNGTTQISFISTIVELQGYCMNGSLIKICSQKSKFVQRPL